MRRLPFSSSSQSWFWRAAPPGASVPHSHSFSPVHDSWPTVRFGVDAAGRIVQLCQLHTDVADASVIEGGVDNPGRHTGIRPLVAHHTVEVDQSCDAVGAGVEHVTAPRKIGVVVRDTAELNEGHGE